MWRCTASLFLFALCASSAKGAVATDAWSAGTEGPHPKAIQIAEQDGGSFLTVSLEGVPRGAKVYRARL